MALSLFKRREDPRIAELQTQRDAERARAEQAEKAVVEVARELQRARITEPIAGPPSPLLPPPPGINLYALDQPIRYSTPQPPTRRPDSLLTTQTMRQMAATTDLVRSAIQHLKREVDAVPGKITARDEKDKAGSVKTGIARSEDFFKIPGGLGGVGSRRSHFEAKIIEDLLVIGAEAHYFRPTRGGKPYEVLAVDAATIRPRIDAYGWPGPTDHVWEQWIYGVQVAALTRDELMYDGLHPLSWTPYFLSAVEMAVLPITTFIASDQWNRTWLTEGTTPGDVYTLPKEYTPAMVKEYAEYFWGLTAGDISRRQRTVFVPGEVQSPISRQRKEHDFGELDDWLLHRILSIMGVQPSSIGYPGKQYKVSQDASYDQTSAFGVGQLLAFRKAIYDDLLQRLGFEELEWTNITSQEEKAQERADRFAKLVAAGIKTINEAREAEGDEPVQGGDMPLVPNTMTTLDQILNPAPDEGITGLEPRNGKEPAGADGQVSAQAQARSPGRASAKDGAAAPSRSARDEERRRALILWSRKAIRRLKDDRPAFCRFESEAIPEALSRRIEEQLVGCESVDAVKRLFSEMMVPEAAAPRGYVAPIFIITHAETLYTGNTGADDRITGWLDPPLTPEGRHEARTFGQRLRGLGIERMDSSTLLRAHQTAQILGGLLQLGPPRQRKELLPWNLGEFQGEKSADVQPDLLRLVRNPEEPAPGGESFREWTTRLLGYLASCLREQEEGGRGALCLVTHSRCLELVRAWMVTRASGEPRYAEHWAVDNVKRGEVLMLTLGPAGWMTSSYDPVWRPTLPAPAEDQRGVETQTERQMIGARWRRRAEEQEAAFGRQPHHEGD